MRENTSRIGEKMYENSPLNKSNKNTDKIYQNQFFSELFKLIKESQQDKEDLFKKNNWI